MMGIIFKALEKIINNPFVQSFYIKLHNFKIFILYRNLLLVSTFFSFENSSCSLEKNLLSTIIFHNKFICNKPNKNCLPAYCLENVSLRADSGSD